MRSGLLILLAAALLGACEPAEPTPAPEPAPIAVPIPPRIPEPEPQVTLSPMNTLPGQSEQARAQAEADRRELDRRAATIQADIAGARQQAEAAVRNARAPEPPPSAAPSPAAAAPPPAQPAGTSPPAEAEPTPGA